MQKNSNDWFREIKNLYEQEQFWAEPPIDEEGIDSKADDHLLLKLDHARQQYE